ncbi:MAG: hypothetical protein IPK60_01490 [Sandaracinaceae bacterium]|nr:hypothetical protein [Sandaracinaceae bacterium]
MKLRTMANLSVAGLLAAFIVGPTPGSVGSCSTEVTYAKAPQFCADKYYWTYQRAYARGEATLEETQANVARIPADCNAIVFSDCTPTQLVADACINALKDGGRLGQTTDSIQECMDAALCPDSQFMEQPDAGSPAVDSGTPTDGGRSDGGAS